jgi:hypothetical protein
VNLVGIRVTLKIGDEFFRFVALLKRKSALFELCRHRLPRPVLLRCVARVIAINAAAHGDFAVAIGTSKIQSQADFVDARVEDLAQGAIERIEPLAPPLGCQCFGKFHDLNINTVNKNVVNTQGEDWAR